MARTRVSALLLCALAACQSSSAPPPSARSEHPPVAPPEGVEQASIGPERRFGAAPTLPGEPLPVEQLLSSADAHVGKTVKCSGLVARVCQAAGCWLELQSKAGGEGLRVPMANHAFFIPKDAVGQLAVIEGELKRSPLPAEQREHYAGEGMKAMGPLSLEATSVTLR